MKGQVFKSLCDAQAVSKAIAFDFQPLLDQLSSGLL